MTVNFERWRNVVPERQRIVMWGAADQARVNHFILSEFGCKIVAFVDDTPGLKSPFPEVPLLDGFGALEEWLKNENNSTLGFIVAIGNPTGDTRCRLHDVFVRAGLFPVSFADSSAYICASAQLGAGLQVMAQALVHNDVSIGRQCLINTRSLVEHDCVLGEGVEIGPGAILCGRVHVGANSWIGAGATVRQRIKIGRDVIIGAGSVVVSDIPDNTIAVGVPAKPMR